MMLAASEDGHSMRAASRVMEDEGGGNWAAETIRKLFMRFVGTIVPNAHRTHGTGQNELYTPAVYIQAARDVMGEIDLDPATSEKCQA